MGRQGGKTEKQEVRKKERKRNEGKKNLCVYVRTNSSKEGKKEQELHKEKRKGKNAQTRKGSITIIWIRWGEGLCMSHSS